MNAILFDCDGVLIESEILYQEIQMQALSELGLVYEKEAYVSRFMGIGNKAFYEEADKDHVKKFGKNLPVTFKDDLEAFLEQEFEKRLKPVENISNVLADITLPMAVASSSRLDFLHIKLAHTGLADFFGEHVYSADLVERAKPFPDLFLFSAGKLKTAPEKCIVIEDSENGVKAGCAANMHVIGFCGASHCNDAHGQRLKNAGADDIAMTIDDLAALLRPELHEQRFSA